MHTDCRELIDRGAEITSGDGQRSLYKRKNEERRIVLEHIRNFVSVMPNLATAGQPSEAQLREVATAGFEVVINLGLLDPQYCLPNEAGIVQSLGLEYHHIPVNFQAPQLEYLRHFFSVMDAVQDKKVFVHCAANKRVSSFVALYGESRLYWSREGANALISRIWQPDEVWALFIAQARQDIFPTLK